MNYPTEKEIIESVGRAKRYLAQKPDWLEKILAKFFDPKGT